MSELQNPFVGQKLEFHVLQSFPVTCLNRDDVGAPKSAMVGGTVRARVSSQCWKRQVRLELHNLGTKIGMRTKLIVKLIQKECLALGATEDQSVACAEEAALFFGKIENGVNETLMFLTEAEAKSVAQAYADTDFMVGKGEGKTKEEKAEDKKNKKEIGKIMKAAFKPAVDGLDVALFGRMVAVAPTMNIDAASSFAHAISTHKVSNEVEFFTALDDNKEEQGSAHMGSLEFNSATYYRYISLDLGQLWINLQGEKLVESVGAFIKAIFLAVPSARQTTMSGACPWGYAKILHRKGQRLQVPFDEAVKKNYEAGFLDASKKSLNEYLEKQERLWGSLFGKIGEIEYGDEKNIDDVISFTNELMAKVE